MKPQLISLAIAFFISIQLSAQVEVNFGYNFGRNTYFESKQDNLSTKFNLGWDFDNTTGGYFIDFTPSLTLYEVKSPMKWNKSTRGLILGLGFNKDNDVSFELNFVGCTNKASGSRTNLTTNLEEKLSIKTKFGGVQLLGLFNVHDRFSLNAGMGVNVFRTAFSWTGETSVKNQIIGLRVKPFSQAVKVGDRDLTLTFPVGFTATIIHLSESEISLKARLLHTFVWNKMVQTDLIYYLPYSYNLNSTTLGIILTKTL